MTVENIGAPPQTIRAGQHIEGARGLMNTAHAGLPGMPGGAIAMSEFTPISSRNTVPPPMQRPVMLDLIKQVTEWFNNYLARTRKGVTLQPGEHVPKILILQWALQKIKQPQRQECLDCMKAEVFQISTSQPVTVYWENQPYLVVPFEARAFPIAVAISILETCRTNIFDSLNILWDERANKYVSRMLSIGERIQVSPVIFREPNEAEKKFLSNESGFISPLMPVAFDGNGSGELLMSFGPKQQPVAVGGAPAGNMYASTGSVHDRSQPPQTAGSAHPNEDATRPPFMTAPVGPATAPAASPTGIPGMPPTPPVS